MLLFTGINLAGIAPDLYPLNPDDEYISFGMIFLKEEVAVGLYRCW